MKQSPDWIEDCHKWRGRQLTGKYAHWCPDWDLLPIDETSPEWPCACFERRWDRWKYRLWINDLIRVIRGA